MDKHKVSRDMIEELKKYSTGNITDTLDSMGIYGGCLDIKPVVTGVKMAGPAFTIRYVPCGLEKGTVGDYIDDVAPGDVVVIDNGGRTYCTVWGDLLSLVAVRRGIAGTVIDGVCRDVDEIRALNYPIFARGCYMITGKERVQVDAYNVPVAVSGVHVRPGDMVFGDGSGVIVVPAEKIGEVLHKAGKVVKAEERIEKAVKEGLGLREAREKFNYHKLQGK